MKVEKLANEARKVILTMVYNAQTSHIASNFSVVDIATVLYDNLEEKDEVVWSKGWSAATIYYFLAKQGKIKEEDLLKFPNPPYLGLAETTVPGVWCNGGSVGHGLSVAVGMALGKKLKGEQGTIYCIMSDGELNEGSVWEAVMFAAHHKLDNLVAVVDANKWQAMGKTQEVMNLEPIQNRFRGFDWYAERVNGHDFIEIKKVLKKEKKHFPLVVVCDTVKGKGVSFMENHLLYHYKHVDEETYNKALQELESK